MEVLRSTCQENTISNGLYCPSMLHFMTNQVQLDQGKICINNQLLSTLHVLLRTGSYVIIVRAQFLYYSQSEGWALSMYQVLEHVVRV